MFFGAAEGLPPEGEVSGVFCAETDALEEALFARLRKSEFESLMIGKKRSVGVNVEVAL